MGKRGNDHIKAQRAGRKSDGEVCQVCGSTHKTQGHHITDFQYGGAADKDNIVTLCSDCHHEVHRGHMDIFRI